MIEKASRPLTAPGGHGRYHSVLPTSNASANYKRRGGVNHWVGLTPSYPPQPPQSTAWEQLSATLPSRLLTTPQSYSSSRWQTWCSLHQTPCSLWPTRSSLRLRLKSLQPRQALLVHLGLPTNCSMGITVGLMAIVSASITQVQRAATRPRGTRTWQLSNTMGGSDADKG